MNLCWSLILVEAVAVFISCRVVVHRSSDPVKRESAVMPGKVRSGDAKENAEREEKRLAEMMIPKKKQRLYRKIMHAKKKVAQEARILAEKRRQHDRKEKQKHKKKSTDML